MVTAELCQKIKCGILSINNGDVSMEQLYECSAQFGPGVLYPCHEDCRQFGACVVETLPVPMPAPLSGKPTQSVMPPLPPIVVSKPLPSIENLTWPSPDITALSTPLVALQGDCEGAWDSLNASIRENPVLAVLALGALVWAFKK